ncbi:MAG: hypothetical protein CFE23_14675 [Flavobacterium sp. BFFFF1]|nr:MAG: hypothetical protein CFE23_14675 [Flavobacterium sp. BFFFF1]
MVVVLWHKSTRLCQNFKVLPPLIIWLMWPLTRLTFNPQILIIAVEPQPRWKRHPFPGFFSREKIQPYRIESESFQ